MEEQHINKLKEVINKNPNGFTIDSSYKSLEHKKGFYVGLTNNNSKDINELIKNLFKLKAKIYKDNIGFISSPLLYGGWKDSKENIFYLDLTIYVENKTEALKIASKQKQKAIWDISKMESVYL